MHLNRSHHRPRRHAGGRRSHGRRVRYGGPRSVINVDLTIRVLADWVRDSSWWHGPWWCLDVGTGRRVRRGAAHLATVCSSQRRPCVTVHHRRRRGLHSAADTLVQPASSVPRRHDRWYCLLTGRRIALDRWTRCDQFVYPLAGLSVRSLRLM